MYELIIPLAYLIASYFGMNELFTQQPFSVTNMGIFLDATLTGIRIRHDYSNGDDCLTAVFEMLDTPYFLNRNLSLLGQLPEYEHASKNGKRWQEFKNTGLLMSAMLSSSGADVVGNCTGTGAEFYDSVQSHFDGWKQ